MASFIFTRTLLFVLKINLDFIRGQKEFLNLNINIRFHVKYDEDFQIKIHFIQLYFFV